MYPAEQMLSIYSAGDIPDLETVQTIHFGCLVARRHQSAANLQGLHAREYKVASSGRERVLY